MYVQYCVSWSSKKRRHHFAFTKSLLKEAIKFLLHNCFFSIGKDHNYSSNWNTNGI